jgi:hypothetical protein
MKLRLLTWRARVVEDAGIPVEEETAITGTYHAFDFNKYGPRFLAEAQYRFDRRFKMIGILPRSIKAAATIGAWTDARLRVA